MELFLLILIRFILCTLLLLVVPIPYASTSNIQKYTLRRIVDLNNVNFQWYSRTL